MQGVLKRALAALLVGACATPPLAQRLDALERRAIAQRARSQEVERQITRIAFLSASSGPLGDAASFYELATFRTSEPLDARYDPGLRLQLAQALTAISARALDYTGVDDERRFTPPWVDQQFQGLPLGAVFALANAAAPHFRGAELDVRVPLEPGPDRRVTVIHAVDGRLHAVDALANESPPGDGPSAEALQARYGVGPVEGWNARERASLEQALALLRPAERARLVGLPFRRKGRGAMGSLGGTRARHCGHFALEDEQRSIVIYNCAFETDPYAFVGPLDQPLLPSVRVILHEIAHALSLSQVGDLFSNVAASQREAQQMIEEFNRLGRKVPSAEVARVEELRDEIETLKANLTRWHEKLEVEGQQGTVAVEAFLELPGASSGFTSYGRTSPIEAFAEAFSVCRTDPEAGRRISPQVCAFFGSDAYLQTGP